MSTSEDAEPVTHLERAHRRYERAVEAVEEVGEDDLQQLADAYDEFVRTLDEYEDQAVGSGDFQAFVEFQGKVGEFTEELPEGLRHREVFERADDRLQQRRLSEGDFQAVRDMFEPVADDVERLEERRAAAEEYRRARHRVERRLGEIDDEVTELERLQELGRADLDAPTERLREPIEAYDDAVREAFREFKRDSSARWVLSTMARAADYPMVSVRRPPDELLEFVRNHEAGTDPISRLLEYAEFSQSKLDHYVEDPTALREAVATRKTYLRRLDAEPFTVGWPPPEGGVIRYRCRELESAISRFADEETHALLRTVRRLPRQENYDRLRDAAVAREELSDDELRRLEDGRVQSELADLEAEREQLNRALEAHSGP